MPRTWGQLTRCEQEFVVEQFLRSGRKYHAVNYKEFDLESSSSTERKIRQLAENYIPESRTPMWSEQILHVDGDAIIIGDLEIPDHDNVTLNLALRVWRAQHIRTLIINGDMISADGLSMHRPSAFPRPTTVSQDIAVTKEILRVLTNTFQEGVFVNTGNHDARLRWYTNGEIGLDALVSGGKVTMTPLGYLYLNSGGVEWKITHPQNYSKIPGSVARTIAINEGINVVVGHTHHLSMSFTSDGKYMAIDGGHCRDVERTAYKVSADNTYPKWINGFVVIKNGYAHALAKEFTDWKMWT